MATTVTPVIANSIGLASEYLPLLDEVYKAESKTSILDTVQDRVRWSDEYHTFYLFETDMDGLANYSRNDGFVRGDVTAQWRAYEPQWDRGRQFLVDRIDNAESMGMAFGTLAGEFMRTKVVPETDAVRFATYASGAAAGMKVTETIATGAAAVAARPVVEVDEHVPGASVQVCPRGDWYFLASPPDAFLSLDICHVNRLN